MFWILLVFARCCTGDLNVYVDYDEPMRELMRRDESDGGGVMFRDAWLEAHPHPVELTGKTKDQIAEAVSTTTTRACCCLCLLCVCHSLYVHAFETVLACPVLTCPSCCPVCVLWAEWSVLGAAAGVQL